jgi:hypothetical protein
MLICYISSLTELLNWFPIAYANETYENNFVSFISLKELDSLASKLSLRATTPSKFDLKSASPRSISFLCFSKQSTDETQSFLVSAANSKNFKNG